MNSFTKLSLPPQSLQLLLESILSPQPQVLSSQELSTSKSLNTVYKIDCAAPYGSLVLKLPPPQECRVLRAERNIFRVEHLVNSFLASRDLIQQSSPFIFDPSQSIIDAQFLVKPFIEGRPLSNTPQADASLVRFLASINQITSPTAAFGSFENPRFSTYKEFFLWMVEGILLDGEETLVLLPYEQIRTEVRRWEWTLGQVTEPRLVVLDLRRDEVLEGEPGELKGLAGGWERALWGSPELQSCLDNPRVQTEYKLCMGSNVDQENGARKLL